MKNIMVIALCLFSIFTIEPIHVFAVKCGATYDQEIINPEDVEKCQGVMTPESVPNIYHDLLFANKILFFITCVLFVFGINLSKEKKEPTKKERLIIDLFCWSPFVSIFFFFIIKAFQNLM